jgi:hypothetical protein
MTPRRDSLTPTPETNFEPPNVWAWSNIAQPGSSIVYWAGNLAEACEREIQAEKQGATKSIARDARRDVWNLYEKGRATLYQRKLSEFVKAYVVELTK